MGGKKDNGLRYCTHCSVGAPPARDGELRAALRRHCSQRITPALTARALGALPVLEAAQAAAEAHIGHISECYPESEVLEPLKRAERIRSECMLQFIRATKKVMLAALERDEPGALEAAIEAAGQLEKRLPQFGFMGSGRELELMVKPSEPPDEIQKTLSGRGAAEFLAEGALNHIETHYMKLFGALARAARAMGVELRSMEDIERDGPGAPDAQMPPKRAVC